MCIRDSHYSDEELAEFRELILEKLVKARHDLELLTEAYTNSNDNDTMDTSPTFKVLEEGYQVLSKEENARLAGRQEKFIPVSYTHLDVYKRQSLHCMPILMGSGLPKPKYLSPKGLR